MVFFKKLSMFLLVAGILAVIPWLYFEQHAKYRDNFVKIADYLSDKNVRPEAIIIGDSRAALNVRRENLPLGYEVWAFPGEGLRQFLLKVDYLLKNKPSVRFIVLSVDDHIFSAYRSDNHTFEKFFSFSDNDTIMESMRPSTGQLMRAHVSSLFPILAGENRMLIRRSLISDLKEALGVESEREPVELNNCYDMVFATEVVWPDIDGETREARVSERLNDQYRDPIVVEEMKGFLKKIFEMAEEHGVEVIGIRSPLSPDYRSRVPEETVELVMANIREFPFVGILDYSRYAEKSPELFNDMDHLNSAGAAVFTAQLASDLSRLTGLPGVAEEGKNACVGRAR